MLDHQLESHRPVPFVGVGAIDSANRGGQGVDAVEEDRRIAHRRVFPQTLQDEPRMLSSNGPLVGNIEYVVESRRRETLAPDLGGQRAGKVQGDFGRL
jgi:hypothetical protein